MTSKECRHSLKILALSPSYCLLISIREFWLSGKTLIHVFRMMLPFLTQNLVVYSNKRFTVDRTRTRRKSEVFIKTVKNDSSHSNFNSKLVSMQFEGNKGLILIFFFAWLDGHQYLSRRGTQKCLFFG
jgi:hypothetical protein